MGSPVDEGVEQCGAAYGGRVNLPKPYYTDESVTIYHADCREILPLLDPGSVDLVLTSPPYNIGLQYDGYDDKQDPEVFQEWVGAWLSDLYSTMQDTARLYLVVSDKMIWWIRERAERNGLTFGQMMVWCKPNFAGGGRINGDWNHMAEWILLFRKGKRTAMLGAGKDVNTHNWFVIPSPQRNCSIIHNSSNVSRRFFRYDGGLLSSHSCSSSPYRIKCS